jgi:hypothetical protein
MILKVTSQRYLLMDLKSLSILPECTDRLEELGTTQSFAQQMFQKG